MSWIYTGFKEGWNTYILFHFFFSQSNHAIWPDPDVDVEDLVVVVHGEGVGTVSPSMLAVPHHETSVSIH